MRDVICVSLSCFLQVVFLPRRRLAFGKTASNRGLREKALPGSTDYRGEAGSCDQAQP